MHELRNANRICVILPISQTEPSNFSHNANNLDHDKINYETSIDSQCLSKPIISFTIKYFEKCVNMIFSIIYLLANHFCIIESPG